MSEIAIPDDTDALRKALGLFTTGVTVVTTLTSEGRRIGLTANSFTSVSLNPPLILWSLSRRSTNLQVFMQAPRFAVNVLSCGQHDLCQRFAKRNDADRFEGVDLIETTGDLPLLAGSLANFECDTYSHTEAGDHVVFLGQVRRFRCDSGDALVFSAGRLRSLAAHAGLEAA